MTEYLLEARGVVAGYAAADMILKGVDLTVAPHEVVAIIGPNGAGKSTLLKAIAGILTPSAGTITLSGSPIQGRPAREICASGLAFVPQEANVFPTMSVRENLEMGGFVQPRETRQRIERSSSASPSWPRSGARPRAPSRAGSGRSSPWRWR